MCSDASGFAVSMRITEAEDRLIPFPSETMQLASYEPAVCTGIVIAEQHGKIVGMSGSKVDM
jgi:hypothetical protein